MYRTCKSLKSEIIISFFILRSKTDGAYIMVHLFYEIVYEHSHLEQNLLFALTYKLCKFLLIVIFSFKYCAEIYCIGIAVY